MKDIRRQATARLSATGRRTNVRPQLRLITQRDGQAFTQACDFTQSVTLYLAKFNKLMVELRGTTVAKMVRGGRRSNRHNKWPFAGIPSLAGRKRMVHPRSYPL
jgi:hypothetical protein